ncbi:MAG: hypothetical protein PHE49_00265 [bacterium]|nr:hypothetical protein [bacterium]
MKKLLGFSAFTISIIIIYSLINFIGISLTKTGVENKLLFGILILFKTILITLWLSGITYKKLWDKNTLRNKTSRIIWSLTLIVVFILLNSSLLLLDRTSKLYKHIKGPSCGWKGKLWQSDTTLGTRPIPNAKGFETFVISKDVPIKFDRNGFRVPVFCTDTTIKRPLFLFLGCSFTFGMACPAEESFPYIVSQDTKGSSMNAGICAGGLSQMLLLSRELVPHYKPDFVIVQYSPWLAQRATLMGAPTYIAVTPVPYISKTKDGKNVISPIAFNSKTLDLNIEKFRGTPKNIRDYTCFLFEIAIPLYLHDVYYRTITALKKILGKIPKPDKNIKDIEQFAYSNIYDVCKQNNSKMIILNLGDITYTKNSHTLILPDSNIIFAEADSLLFRRLKSPDEYNKEYMHWCFNGKDSVIEDVHPTYKANKIIAEAIVTTIKENTPKTNLSYSCDKTKK